MTVFQFSSPHRNIELAIIYAQKYLHASSLIQVIDYSTQVEHRTEKRSIKVESKNYVALPTSPLLQVHTVQCQERSSWPRSSLVGEWESNVSIQLCQRPHTRPDQGDLVTSSYSWTKAPVLILSTQELGPTPHTQAPGLPLELIDKYYISFSYTA